MISDEDAKLLKYAGFMGHRFVGIVGMAGKRRTACEVNTLDAARTLCDDPDLTVYSTNGGKRRKWLNCYDRAQERLGQSIIGKDPWTGK